MIDFGAIFCNYLNCSEIPLLSTLLALFVEWHFSRILCNRLSNSWFSMWIVAKRYFVVTLYIFTCAPSNSPEDVWPSSCMKNLQFKYTNVIFKFIDLHQVSINRNSERWNHFIPFGMRVTFEFRNIISERIESIDLVLVIMS